MINNIVAILLRWNVVHIRGIFTLLIHYVCVCVWLAQDSQCLSFQLCVKQRQQTFQLIVPFHAFCKNVFQNMHESFRFVHKIAQILFH